MRRAFIGSPTRAAFRIILYLLSILGTLAAFVITLVYEGFVARVALDISPFTAAWVVGMDVAISVGVHSIVEGLIS